MNSIINKAFGKIHRKLKYTFNSREIEWRQLQKNFPHEPVITELNKNLKVRIYPFDVIGKDIYVDGVFEKDQCEFISYFLQEGMTFFDIGANLGQYTLLAADKIGSAGSVHCFEPNKRMFDELSYNIGLNNFQGRCNAGRMAVSNENGTAEFCCYEKGAEVYGSLRQQQWDNKELLGTDTVETVTLDSYVMENNIKQVDLIKMDIEGAELLALKGAGSLLSRDDAPVIVLEIADKLTKSFDYSGLDVWNLLVSYGYEFYSIQKHGSMVKMPGNPEVFTGGEHLVAMKNRI